MPYFSTSELIIIVESDYLYFQHSVMDSAGDIEMKGVVVSPMPSEPLSKDSESRSESGLQNEDQAEIVDPDCPQFKLRFLLNGHKRAVSCLKFNSGGTYLASACTSMNFVLGFGGTWPGLTVEESLGQNHQNMGDRNRAIRPYIYGTYGRDIGCFLVG